MLSIKPISLLNANKFIIKFHRHHYKVQGHKFSISCYDDDKLVGVACCGRPVSRYLDDGLTMEVTRLCTNGVKNTCSKLYSTCARICQEMGYKKIITYISQFESGHSLLCSGWFLEKENVGGENWNSKKRQRTIEIIDLFGVIKKYPSGRKKRYTRILNN